MRKESTLAISLITILAVLTTASMSLPAVYAKKHHHFTDTQKEDNTASDAQGNPCNFGPSHDQCRVQFEQSQDKSCHFGPNHDECFKEAWTNDS